MPAPEASVVVERNLLIPLPDGAHLAADLYRPIGEGPWPAIVDYIPYHKDGRGGRLDVEAVNRYFAARGYAALTVDIRGLGSSGGVNPFPFDTQEARDGHVAVEWVAAQPWCDGNVGMWGVSYGGITALAVAATRPPHLRAIVPIHAGADLYHDVIAPGGCRGGFWLQADWGPRMVAFNLVPPLWQDPDGRWERVWAAHLEANGPWLFSWWDHPDFDDFWASRVIPVERIEAATFNIGGWRDLYAEATVRDHARIRAPKRLLMGPWKHAFPDVALEAPAPGLHEMERWWKRWLRGKDNGVPSEPTVTLYVQGHDAGWQQGAAWPSPDVWNDIWRIDGDGVLQPARAASRAQRPPARPACWPTTRPSASAPSAGTLGPRPCARTSPGTKRRRRALPRFRVRAPRGAAGAAGVAPGDSRSLGLGGAGSRRRPALRRRARRALDASHAGLARPGAPRRSRSARPGEARRALPGHRPASGDCLPPGARAPTSSRRRHRRLPAHLADASSVRAERPPRGCGGPAAGRARDGSDASRPQAGVCPSPRHSAARRISAAASAGRRATISARTWSRSTPPRRSTSGSTTSPATTAPTATWRAFRPGALTSAGCSRRPRSWWSAR